MIIQIYEVQEADEARAMIRLGVDHIGSVLLSADEWKRPEIRSTIETVRAEGAVSSLIPLFGEASEVLACLDYYQPDIVHFCEDLSGPLADRPYIREKIALQRTVNRTYPGIRIMRSIPIGLPGKAGDCPTLELAKTFENDSDLFLTDTLITDSNEDQPVSGFIGITGRVCDWRMARRLVAQSRIPVILAGGIGPGNVAAAIEAVRPYGVDSCTGTNQQDNHGRPVRFRKDRDRVAVLVAEVRRVL
jgi:phosphoribosylanthranilate isomerase